MNLKGYYNGGIMNFKEDICLMMEINYLKVNNRDINGNNDDLFPFNWYSIKDYQKKAEILLEAINDKVKIIDTKKYQDMGNDVI